LAVFVAACSSPEAATPRGAIVVGIRTAPNNIDPRLGNDEASARVAQLIFSTLFNIGDDLRPTPLLAERLDNPDPLTYVVTLKRGVKFHDGHEMTARDVVFTYSQMIDPAFLSPFKGAFRSLKSVRALDDYHVVFLLKEPFAAFPIQLAGLPAIIPAGSGSDFGEHPIGTGPYKFVSYTVDDEVVLAPFAGYFDGPPKNTGIVIKVLPDDTMRGLEVRKGSIDLVVNDLPPDIVRQLGSHLVVATSPGLDYSYLGMNMRDPILRDKRVRQAIGYAIDRKAIVEYLRRGLARPATGLIPSLAWAYEPDVFQFTYDPDKSKQLLDEAGYTDPDGDGPRPRLHLTLKVSNADETQLQAAVIQQDLARVGIDLEVRSYEFATMYADVLKGTFQMFSLQWVGAAMVDPDILRRVFHSTQMPVNGGFNRGYYSNPEVDRLLDLAGTASSESERKQYYGAVQKIVAEDAPYISLWNRTNVAVAQPSLHGLHLNAVSDFESLKDVTKAY
jgi:peptide/nickel transport system substrate-binding protein